METIQWEKNVPIFRNRFILKGLGIALGIPFGILILFIIFLSGGDILGTDAKYPLFLIGLLFLLTFLFIFIVYGGTYAAGFIIDEKGITNYTQKHQAKKNKIINSLLIFLGLFSGRYSAAGSGFLAQQRQTVRIKWRDIRKVTYYPKDFTIMISGGFSQKIALFCTPKNFERVKATIEEKMPIINE